MASDCTFMHTFGTYLFWSQETLFWAWTIQ